ncbi:MAG: chemotaxis-specific protein-glutamate methyltransferase CheB [Methylotetracoccus sp.]
MKIAIVNDLALAREALRRVVSASPGLEICWTAQDGAEAVERCRAERPDVVLMDLIMPAMDGVEATRRIMACSPCPVLVVTATIEGHFTKVYDAMGAGALDAVETPSLGPDGALRGGDALLRKIATIGALTRTVPARGDAGRSTLPADRRQAIDERAGTLPYLIAIGASTGGPNALATILAGCPLTLPGAVLIVQHIDARFTSGLVDWLSQRSRLPVMACPDGTHPRAGHVYVAAQDRHLTLDRSGILRYAEAPEHALHRPSIDVLFQSIAECPGSMGCGIVLTGMGRDGASGLRALRQAGFVTIAQDRESSVVWGIPGAAVACDAASLVLPLDQIAPRVLECLSALHAPPPSSTGS